MKKYTPEIIRVNPNRIIPFHEVLSIKKELIQDYTLGRYIPPIPIIAAPDDLRGEGDYINYNGHHRTLAARIAKVYPTCILLKSWEDIGYLLRNPPFWNGQVYPELIEGLEKNFEAHRDFVISEARRFLNLRKTAASMGKNLY